MLAMQNDTMANPISLWLDKGKTLWTAMSRPSSCAQCHGAIENHKTLRINFPNGLLSIKKLINMEDQIVQCSQRTSQASQNLEDANVLSLSALLHQQSKFQPILLRPQQRAQRRMAKRTQRRCRTFHSTHRKNEFGLYALPRSKRWQKMQADFISPGHPTGFPIFKMNWQSMGSIDRRIRACYSGVQAEIPQAGSQELRQLELFLKMRAEGLAWMGRLRR
jgi:L-cysteine S-thiosulfotransferase